MSSNLNDRDPVNGVNPSRMYRHQRRNILSGEADALGGPPLQAASAHSLRPRPQPYNTADEGAVRLTGDSESFE
ncbi:hypothetical protein GCM10010377_52820 [Streptomyces viridiviolaceus]|nr:hypothetical protein GCM10010377_52820 [Streptomyces viridiviolaceus]